MIIEQPPSIFRRLYPQAWWRLHPEKQNIYLTFDDGPIPEVTPWVLDLLKYHEIKATFFVVGENAQRYPDLLRRIRKEGHRLGNHSYNHLSGFGCSSLEYLENINKANELLQTNLFRPPHGRISMKQYCTVSKRYQLVMWDVVTRDYSCKLTPNDVFSNVKCYSRNGSIITFHDSLKSWQNDKLKIALPQSIEYLKSKGFLFKPLP